MYNFKASTLWENVSARILASEVLRDLSPTFQNVTFTQHCWSLGNNTQHPHSFLFMAHHTTNHSTPSTVRTEVFEHRRLALGHNRNSMAGLNILSNHLMVLIWPLNQLP